MYHGSHNEIMGTNSAHLGLCLTDDDRVAERYAGRNGIVYTADIDLDELDVVEVDGYDRDSDIAPGDLAEEYECDVIVFDDEDESGRWHRTWRLVSQKAVDACRLYIEE
jgi:hypothetical protein